MFSTLCAVDASTRTALHHVNDALAGDGLRVIAVASGTVAEPAESALSGLTFDGFIGLADPPAAGVKETIASLRSAGLRTVMLTGDQRLTAEAVGRELGLLTGDVRAVEGRVLEGLSKEDLEAAAADTAVFSRITPEHKLRIVARSRRAAKSSRCSATASTTRLRCARPTSASRWAGAAPTRRSRRPQSCCRDDRFETIAAAVEEGRVIFDNIRKFVLYLFSCNVAEMLVLLVRRASPGCRCRVEPLQLLWLNMVTDTFPALALAVEPGDTGVMERPPRDPDRGHPVANLRHGHPHLRRDDHRGNAGRLLVGPCPSHRRRRRRSPS